MKKISFLSLFLAIGALSIQMSCTNSSASTNTSGTTIKGSLENAENLSFYFDKINFDNSNIMYPNAEIDGSGNFELIIEDKLDPGIYRMRIGAKRSYIVLDGTEKSINIEGNLNTFDKSDYKLEGVPASMAFIQNMKGFFNRNIDKAAMENYVKSESNSIAAAFASVNVFGNDLSKIDLLRSINQKLKAQYPNSTYAKDFDGVVQAQEGNLARQKANELVQIGNPAPEIKLKDPNGKEIALSDLKGKIVLLDFWASWCGPCRKANPHVVETYHKYKNQGFTVYSVSLDGINPRLLNRYKTQEEVDKQLDAAKERWKTAIQQDHLAWDYHVSDLQYWNSIAAKTYGVSSIPKTFLIDRDGKIASVNPRFTLEEEIKKLL